jgi:hypothetical protein
LRHAFAAAVLCASLLAAPAVANQPQPSGERLLMSPPAGWKPVVMQRGEKVSITRLYPPNQDENNWSELVTVQIYPSSEQSPRTFIDGAIHYSRESCEAAGASAVTERTANGYPMATVSITCTKGTKSGMGGFVLIQAIRGKDALYVVQRQWRGQPFERNQNPPFPPGLLQDWARFSQQVSLCDTRDNRYPCPQ